MNNKKYTQVALSMLTCCMQKVSAEIIDSINKTPTWHDTMAGIVMGLGETIYKIENDKLVDDNDEESELVIDLSEE